MVGGLLHKANYIARRRMWNRRKGWARQLVFSNRGIRFGTGIKSSLTGRSPVEDAAPGVRLRSRRIGRHRPMRSLEVLAAFCPLFGREEVWSHLDEPRNHFEDGDAVPRLAVPHAKTLFVETGDDLRVGKVVCQHFHFLFGSGHMQGRIPRGPLAEQFAAARYNVIRAIAAGVGVTI